MELSHWNKKEQAPLVEFLGASLLSHPLMMYYCPDRDKREKFITRYMEHNLPRWTQTGTVLVSDPAHAVGVLLPKDAPEYRSPQMAPKGKMVFNLPYEKAQPVCCRQKDRGEAKSGQKVRNML